MMRANWIGWALLLMLVSCAKPETAETPAASPTPAIAFPSLPPSASPSPSPTATPKLQTFREKNGRFEISFPRGYTHKTTPSGVAFVSADQGFAGAVDFSASEGKPLDRQQLEAALKTEFTTRLKEITWQTTQVQPDGSLRLDWTGKDQSGNALDAVSIVEQRGNYIFVLNLFGVNKPYQNYNSDAETIVNSYRVQPPATTGSSPSPTPNPSQPLANPQTSPSSSSQ
ncbi:MAG: hypothetical protein MUF72_04415 [Elainella sp. Prado103]|jgi:hypothetical protein|nr:hypothetical protein [Elainella sp. Prado103]